MAYRQYIGARYVPLYAGDWDSTRNYEPLTIVTDANGNSYTSMKDVPAGTQLNNRDYWILTSSFSGAVEHLQREVQALQGDVSALDGRVDGLNEVITEGEVLTIADSYGTVVNASGKTAPSLFAEYCSVTVRQFAKGGASFKSGTLLEGLRQFVVPDATKIKTIIIFCGANDAWGSEEAIVDGITDLVTYCKSGFTNVKRIVLCCCGLTMGTLNGSAPERYKVVNAYVRGAYLNGITYLQNSEAVLHNTALLQADKVHPTTTNGVVALAKMLVAAYRGDAVAVHEQILVTMSQSSDSPSGLLLQTGGCNMSIDDGVVHMQALSPAHGLVAFNASTPLTFSQGVPEVICDLNNTMIDGLSTNYTTYFSVSGIVHLTDGSRKEGALLCVIEDMQLKAILLTNYLGATQDNVSAFTSLDMEVTLPLNRF